MSFRTAPNCCIWSFLLKMYWFNPILISPPSSVPIHTQCKVSAFSQIHTVVIVCLSAYHVAGGHAVPMSISEQCMQYICILVAHINTYSWCMQSDKHDAWKIWRKKKLLFFPKREFLPFSPFVLPLSNFLPKDPSSATTLYHKSDLYIPRNETVRPRSQFLL